MSALAFPPDDDTLLRFMLGTLPADRVERVRAWLESDPANSRRLDRFDTRDPLTDALTDGPPDEPVPPSTIERVLRAVAVALRAPAPGDTETHAPTAEGATVSLAVAGVPAHAHQPQPWPPVRLGGFRIVRELGHGGMGYVFEAEDEKLGRRVAIKVLTPDLAKREDAAARFLREARAAAAVDHENVVPVLHVDDAAGTPFMVMPLLQGVSLADRLKHGNKLTVAEVVRVGRDVAAGLGAAHAKGLVHRDLKPGNIWLDAGTGRARVLDFGLARQGDGADALTQAGALLGTPAYMSPEQLDGQPASARSDLFALGAVLYECATGARAFDGPTITAILKAVSDHHPPAPGARNPDVPGALSDLIVRMLAKNPAARPASAADVLAALAGDLPLAQSEVPTVTWVDRELKPTSKRRRAVWIAAGSAVAALLAVAVWFGTRPPAPAVATPTPAAAPDPPPAPSADPPKPVRYKGGVEVRIERDGPDGAPTLYRLNEPGALPLRPQDTFAIEAEVDPPGFVYLLWIDPGADVTAVYPWNPTVADWKGTRPKAEEKVSWVRLPKAAGRFYRAWDAKPGIATVLMLVRDTPLDVPDATVAGWFKGLPEVPPAARSDTTAIWHENFAEVSDPLRRRAGFAEVGGSDPFARWQGALQKTLSERNIQFQSTASFARTGTAK